MNHDFAIKPTHEIATNYVMLEICFLTTPWLLS